jgi:hypothetical protein
MSAFKTKAGTTSYVTSVDIADSTSTTGGGKTGLAHNTASLTCYYKRSNGTASVSVSLASITTLGTFVSGGFKEVDATYQPGHYEFHPPDASIAAGAQWVRFYFVGATGMVRTPLHIALTAVDEQSATAFITGVNSLAPPVGWNLPTFTGTPTIGGTGTLTITGAVATQAGTLPITTTTMKADVDTIKTNPVVNAGTVTFPANATLASTTGAVGSVTGAVGSVTGNVGGNVTGSVGSISGVTFPTNFADMSITATTGIVKADLETIKTQAVTCAAAVTIYPAVGMTATANGNFEIVFATDFATNYDTGVDKWNVTGAGGASAVDIWSYGTRELTGTNSLVFDGNLTKILGTSITSTGSNVAGSFSSFFDVGSPVLTTASNNQTGDSFARIGANGGSLTEIPNMIFNTALPGAYSAGTCGYYIDAQISAAGGGGGASVADIFNEALPGAYAAGSAGYIIGTNLNATVSSRATQTSVDTIDDLIDTEIATLQTSVDDIPTVAEFNARTLPSADYFDPAADTVATVNLVNTLTTYTGNTPQTADVAALITTVGVAGAGLSAIPKTGFKLASDGLDTVAITAPSTVAANFREMVVQVWRRFFKKTVYSDAGNTIITYADDGTTVVTTQTATSAAGVETQGPAT